MARRTHPFRPVEGPRRGPHPNPTDDTGIVTVIVVLSSRDGRRTPNGYEPGNIRRSFRIADAKVSEVVEFLKRAAFGD